MEWLQGVTSTGKALIGISWRVWNPPLTKLLEQPALRGMGSIPERYPRGAFMTLMAMAGLNDYRTRRKAEIGYWPPFWEHVNKNRTPSSPVEMEIVLKPFFRGERFWEQKVPRLHRFLSSQLADDLWNMRPEHVAESLPDLWRCLARTMNQKCEAKTIAFAPRTIGTGLRILGVDSFNYQGIPIPVDDRIRKLTSNLTDKHIRRFWAKVLEEEKRFEPRISMYHLDSFQWSYIGSEDKMAWLKSWDVDKTSGEQIINAFREIAEVQSF